MIAPSSVVRSTDIMFLPKLADMHREAAQEIADILRDRYVIGYELKEVFSVRTSTRLLIDSGIENLSSEQVYS